MPFFQYVTILSIVLCDGVANACAYPIEPVVFYAAKDVVQIEQGVHRPTPGNECKSYIRTESDKICLISTPDAQTEPSAEIGESDEQTISYEHQLENNSDTEGLYDSLEYPDYVVPEEVESYKVLLDSEPVPEDETKCVLCRRELW